MPGDNAPPRTKSCAVSWPRWTVTWRGSPGGGDPRHHTPTRPRARRGGEAGSPGRQVFHRRPQRLLEIGSVQTALNAAGQKFRLRLPFDSGELGIDVLLADELLGLLQHLLLVLSALNGGWSWGVERDA